MDDFSTGKVNKLTSFRKPKIGQQYVKGADLQIHVPTPKEAQAIDEKGSFKNVLGGYIDQVNASQHEADSQVQRLVSGQTEDLHKVMIAMDEAETSFQMMMEVRNKLVDAYKELSRMGG